jgi:hypothetical protein
MIQTHTGTVGKYRNYEQRQGTAAGIVKVCYLENSFCHVK